MSPLVRLVSDAEQLAARAEEHAQTETLPARRSALAAFARTVTAAAHALEAPGGRAGGRMNTTSTHLLTFEEARAYLGGMSPKHFRRLVAKGEIKQVRLGAGTGRCRLIRYDRVDLDKFVASRKGA